MTGEHCAQPPLGHCCAWRKHVCSADGSIGRGTALQQVPFTALTCHGRCISLDQVEGKAAENYGVGFGYHDDDTFHTYFRESDRVPEEPEDDNNGEEEVRILFTNYLLRCLSRWLDDSKWQHPIMMPTAPLHRPMAPRIHTEQQLCCCWCYCCNCCSCCCCCHRLHTWCKGPRACAIHVHTVEQPMHAHTHTHMHMHMHMHMHTQTLQATPTYLCVEHSRTVAPAPPTPASVLFAARGCLDARRAPSLGILPTMTTQRWRTTTSMRRSTCPSSPWMYKGVGVIGDFSLVKGNTMPSGGMHAVWWLPKVPTRVRLLCVTFSAFMVCVCVCARVSCPCPWLPAGLCTTPS
jgi:hypothetical protein